MGEDTKAMMMLERTTNPGFFNVRPDFVCENDDFNNKMLIVVRNTKSSSNNLVSEFLIIN